jgi:quercetin dioxygenase-like cupin family protein
MSPVLEKLAAEIPIPETGMTKTPLVLPTGAHVMGFGFAAGYELKQHTAPADVLLHFLEGEAEVTLGEEQRQVSAETVIQIPANLPHSVRATTGVKMLLVLLRSA